jgi:gas vesicle protein
MDKKTQKKSGKGAAVVGAGVVGFLIGAMVGVFGAPKDGDENRKEFFDWMRETSADLNEKVSGATEMTQEKYDDMVDMVTSKYGKAKKIKDTDLQDFAKELKAHWKKVKKDWKA